MAALVRNRSTFPSRSKRDTTIASSTYGRTSLSYSRRMPRRGIGSDSVTNPRRRSRKLSRPGGMRSPRYRRSRVRLRQRRFALHFIVQGDRLKPETTLTPHLYHNLGGLRFEDVTEKAGIGHTGWGQGVCAGDVDNLSRHPPGRNRIFGKFFGKWL